MGPLTETTPKPMLPVADRPLVAHVADAAVAAGADELVFIVGYGAKPIRAYFGTEYAGVPVTYHEYEAGHAFANPSGESYDPQAAGQAWTRTTDFLSTHLYAAE